jgi:Bacterial regulatory proteins, luxR family
VGGHTNREIATRIGTSEQVVKNHLRSAFDKLGVWSRLELALYVASHAGANWENTVAVIAPRAASAAAAGGRTGTGMGIGMEQG